MSLLNTILGLILRITDSISLGETDNLYLLTSAQVMLMFLVQGGYLEKHCSNPVSTLKIKKKRVEGWLIFLR